MIRVSFLNAVAFCDSDGPGLDELDTARRWSLGTATLL
jgi:hypothetical protein